MTRARFLAAGAVVALAVVGAFLVVGGHGTNGLASAQRVLRRESRFVNGPSAGAAFADVSNLLLTDAKSCARRYSAKDQRCAARYSAAAYASVTAFALVGCTQPGVYEARTGALAQLDGIVAVDRAKGRLRAPRLPDVPRCA